LTVDEQDAFVEHVRNPEHWAKLAQRNPAAEAAQHESTGAGGTVDSTGALATS